MEEDKSINIINDLICIIDQYFEQQSLFYDLEFPANDKSLYISDIRGTSHSLQSKIEWKRCSELYDEPLLFKNGIDSSDIHQGALENCWFLCTVACIATQPNLVKKLFVEQEYNAKGCYHIKLFHEGAWCQVVIDDYLPCIHDKNLNKYTPIYTNAKDGEIWVALLEKAYAKLFGCYERLNDGTPFYAFNNLTGCPVEINDIEFNKNEMKEVEVEGKLWLKLLKYQRENILMSLVCDNNTSEMHGIKKNHCYAILDVKQHVINNKVIRLLNIRNPWGFGEWTGSWSDTSSEWTKEMIDAFKPTLDINDGNFWMSYHDVLKYFERIVACYTNTELTQSSIHCNIGHEHSSFQSFTQLIKLDVPKNNICEWIALYDKDMRQDINGSNYQTMEEISTCFNHEFNVFIFKMDKNVEENKEDIEKEEISLKILDKLEAVGCIGMTSNRNRIFKNCRLSEGSYLLFPFTESLGIHDIVISRYLNDECNVTDNRFMDPYPDPHNSINFRTDSVSFHRAFHKQVIKNGKMLYNENDLCIYSLISGDLLMFAMDNATSIKVQNCSMENLYWTLNGNDIFAFLRNQSDKFSSLEITFYDITNTNIHKLDKICMESTKTLLMVESTNEERPIPSVRTKKQFKNIKNKLESIENKIGDKTISEQITKALEEYDKSQNSPSKKAEKVINSFSENLPVLVDGIRSDDPAKISMGALGMLAGIAAVGPPPFGQIISAVLGLAAAIASIFVKKGESTETILTRVITRAQFEDINAMSAVNIKALDTALTNLSIAEEEDNIIDIWDRFDANTRAFYDIHYTVAIKEYFNGSSFEAPEWGNKDHLEKVKQRAQLINLYCMISNMTISGLIRRSKLLETAQNQCQSDEKLNDLKYDAKITSARIKDLQKEAKEFLSVITYPNRNDVGTVALLKMSPYYLSIKTLQKSVGCETNKCPIDTELENVNVVIKSRKKGKMFPYVVASFPFGRLPIPHRIQIVNKKNGTEIIKINTSNHELARTFGEGENQFVFVHVAGPFLFKAIKPHWNFFYICPDLHTIPQQFKKKNKFLCVEDNFGGTWGWYKAKDNEDTCQWIVEDFGLLCLTGF